MNKNNRDFLNKFKKRIEVTDKEKIYAAALANESAVSHLAMAAYNADGELVRLVKEVDSGKAWASEGAGRTTEKEARHECCGQIRIPASERRTKEQRYAEIRAQSNHQGQAGASGTPHQGQDKQQGPKEDEPSSSHGTSQPPQIVIVEWEDSWSDARVGTGVDPTKWLVTTVGHVLHDDDEMIVIAQSVDDRENDERYWYTQNIPKRMVDKITYL